MLKKKVNNTSTLQANLPFNITWKCDEGKWQ